MRMINAVIHTVANCVLENGYVEVENGRIKAVGAMADITPCALDTDMGGRHILPGLIDAHTCLGLKEDSLRYEGNDWNEADRPVSADLCPWDGFNPDDRAVLYALRGGVTTVGVAASNANLTGSCVSAVKLCRDSRAEQKLSPCCALKLSLGEASKNKKTGPVTRMAQMSMLRDLFDEAKLAVEADNVPRRLATVAKALKGEIPVFVHAMRADDIMAAVDFAGDYGLKCVIVHGFDAAIVGDRLAEAGVPVIVGSLIMTPSSYENRNQNLDLPALLKAKGVKFAITTDHHQSPIQMLGVSAALAVRDGLDRETALRSVTLTPAELLGIADRVGSVEAGKDADLLVFSGDPIRYNTKLEKVYISGREMPL